MEGGSERAEELRRAPVKSVWTLNAPFQSEPDARPPTLRTPPHPTPPPWSLHADDRKFLEVELNILTPPPRRGAAGWGDGGSWMAAKGTVQGGGAHLEHRTQAKVVQSIHHPGLEGGCGGGGIASSSELCHLEL